MTFEKEAVDSFLNAMEQNMVYIVTITMNDGRSIIQGVYYDEKRAEKEAQRIQQGRDDFTVYVTETQIID